MRQYLIGDAALAPYPVEQLLASQCLLCRCGKANQDLHRLGRQMARLPVGAGHATSERLYGEETTLKSVPIVICHAPLISDPQTSLVNSNKYLVQRWPSPLGPE
jgi:hypothetical protein